MPSLLTFLPWTVALLVAGCSVCRQGAECGDYGTEDLGIDPGQIPATSRQEEYSPHTIARRKLSL